MKAGSLGHSFIAPAAAGAGRAPGFESHPLRQLRQVSNCTKGRTPKPKLGRALLNAINLDLRITNRGYCGGGSCGGDSTTTTARFLMSRRLHIGRGNISRSAFSELTTSRRGLGTKMPFQLTVT